MDFDSATATEKSRERTEPFSSSAQRSSLSASINSFAHFVKTDHYPESRIMSGSIEEIVGLLEAK